MNIVRHLAVAAVALMVASAAIAQTRPTAEQAKSITLKAAELVSTQGVEAARPVLHQEGEFRHGEIYVNVIDFEGHWLVYPPRPAGEGQSMINVKDADGKLIVQEIIKLAKERGEGWVEYRWVNPASNRIEAKVSYVKRVPNLEVITYVGTYK
jgi:signal transduction histidine kinase